MFKFELQWKNEKIRASKNESKCHMRRKREKERKRERKIKKTRESDRKRERESKKNEEYEISKFQFQWIKKWEN